MSATIHARRTDVARRRIADRAPTAVAAILVAWLVAACGTGGSVASPSSPGPSASNDPAPTPSTAGSPDTDGAIGILAAGDVAKCDNDRDEQTARLLMDRPEAVVLGLGDLAYESGSPEEFRECYEPSWGQAKDRTHPVPGNHEYETEGAAGYFDYFGAAAGDPAEGFYAFDLGSWRIYALNSNCSDIGGCGTSSPQETWLREDLQAHPAACTLAFWHHARFSSGSRHGDDDKTAGLWAALAEAGADVVLAGHDHHYERFARRDARGDLSPAGIRSFVVGTGGASLRHVGDPSPGSEVRLDETHGVLEMTLREGGFDWAFLPMDGGPPADEGSDSCTPPAS